MAFSQNVVVVVVVVSSLPFLSLLCHDLATYARVWATLKGKPEADETFMD